MARKKAGVAIGKWFLLWTSIGCIFAVQLWWYYELPWSLAVFWGIADWYLWGLLAMGILAVVRFINLRDWSLRSRVSLYALFAPVMAAVHVLLTLIAGGATDLPIGLDWPGYFEVLYAKKLALNLVTFAAIVSACEYASRSTPRQQNKLLARKRDTTRLVEPEQIIWAEVSGNYVNLQTDEGVWPVRETLTRLVHLLPEQQFLRISRSQLVNLDRVHQIEDKSGRLRIDLLDGSSLQVSRRYAARVRQALGASCLNRNS